MGDGEREVRFDCPWCDAPATYRGEYRRGVEVECGRCGQDVTRAFKRALFARVATDISARLVEKENRAFLEDLGDAWRTGGGGSG